MTTGRYYLFNDMLEDSDAGFPQSQILKLPRARASWISGLRHVMGIALPIEVQLNPQWDPQSVMGAREFTRLVIDTDKAGCAPGCSAWQSARPC